MECKRQRDNIQTQEYVEQLRAELAAAEQALAAESAEQSSATESVNLVTASISTTEVPYGAKENLVFPDNL
ncbi:hypothetical protein KIN20_007028 [Parelaphostrongylus tenuis]|uniref:Uncharacterized protein n=1 Tax=Parelaphostrongylus tenuis TaxID=148309 RepID=A0AAD5MLJ8_PARTN|nr:hypothetical protein KIN20_007028 [Parelaphostrongylus tenuis]